VPYDGVASFALVEAIHISRSFGSPTKPAPSDQQRQTKQRSTVMSQIHLDGVGLKNFQKPKRWIIDGFLN
jgi:hypothetical protein